MDKLNKCATYAMFIIYTWACVSGCKEGINRNLESNSTRVGCEFRYEGCQYLKSGHGVAHKGNCDNPIHTPNNN